MTVLPTVAISGQGVSELVARLHEHRALLQRQGRFEALNRTHDLRRMQSYFQSVVQARLRQRIDGLGLQPRLEAALAQGAADPLGAARALADAVLPLSIDSIPPPPGLDAAVPSQPTETTP